MHFEILVEDTSGKKSLDILMPKIIGEKHTFKVISYKGIGHIPKNLKPGSNAAGRILLDQLPRLLRGYGKKFTESHDTFKAVVILVCDLDDKCLKTFREELFTILDSCSPKPETRFCIAVEEGEAWFLGDMQAVRSAYPNAKKSVLTSYEQDSICGTWELLADAIFKGGSAKLLTKGQAAVGQEKSLWAEKITPHMDINNNSSPSFRYFLSKIQKLAEADDTQK